MDVSCSHKHTYHETRQHSQRYVVWNVYISRVQFWCMQLYQETGSSLRVAWAVVIRLFKQLFHSAVCTVKVPAETKLSVMYKTRTLILLVTLYRTFSRLTMCIYPLAAWLWQFTQELWKIPFHSQHIPRFILPYRLSGTEPISNWYYSRSQSSHTNNQQQIVILCPSSFHEPTSLNLHNCSSCLI